MAYENETKDIILDRMLSTVDADIDKRQGSVVYDMLSPASIELALAYIELGLLLDKGFADTAYGEYLDRRVGELGITRKPAIKAKGSLIFSGTNGTAIPAGTRVSTDSLAPVYFVTTASGTIIGGSIVLAAEAEIGGTNGNVIAGDIKLVLGNLNGVVTVTNSATFDGGVDVESDADLLGRYVERASAPASSGNANDYRAWAKEIAGISDAKVYPVWNGNGTVKVVLLDTDSSTPTPEKVQEVRDHIESVRPIGATVTVEGVIEVPINISLTVTLASFATLDGVKAQIEQGVRDYLTSLAFKDPLVRYTQIQKVVLDVPDIVDYSGLTVNGGTANIEIADGSVAMLGAVNVS